MKSVQKQAWIDLHVETQCEACANRYEYDYRVKEEGWAGFDIEGRVKERLKDGDFGVRRCPSCKHLQSWMQKKWKQKWQGIFACLTAFPLTILIAIVLQWPETWPSLGGWLPLLFYVVILFLCSLPGYYFAAHFIRPNWWHGAVGYLPKTPQVTIK
ncbi:MAG: hypothetical protein JW888_12975 [Pirellulales bacterium]|nr:hypothetical protein [Pirellulales bacterium]